MSCDTEKFVITRSVANEFVLTIKQTGTTLPMEIEDTDTFEAQLIKLADDSVVLTKTLTTENAANGKVKLAITLEEAAALDSEKGSKVDRYYIMPTYKLVIDCDTVNNGSFIAKVSEIYVD